MNAPVQLLTSITLTENEDIILVKLNKIDEHETLKQQTQTFNKVKWGLFDRKKIAEFDFVRWPNSIAETCKMTKFERTVNLTWLSLTEIKVCKRYFWITVCKLYRYDYK